ncbi:MAG: M64 family metallopeptidase [Rikenellaceae bacterium]
MKNLYKIFFAVVVVVATMVGCNETDINDSILYPEVEPTGDFRVVASTTSSGDTKVNIDDLEVTWSTSDIIAIAEVGANGKFTTLQNYVIDSSTISEDGKYAEFTGPNLIEGRQYIAYNYISDIYVASYSTYQISESVFCPYNYSNFDCDNVDMLMQSNIFEYDGESLPQLYFSYKSSLLELNIELKSGSSYEGVLESIEISSSTGEDIFLIAPIFNSYGQYTYAFSGDQQFEASNKIELQPTSGIKLSASNSISLIVPITWNGYITEAEGSFNFSILFDDDTISEVIKPMQILRDGVRYTATLTLNDPYDISDVDRAILVELYNSTGGSAWSNSSNWCSNAALSDWYGVSVNADNRVVGISLRENNLTGDLPIDIISQLTELESLEIPLNSFNSGSISTSISKLTKLQLLDLGANNITGSIPSEIGSLTNLTYLSLCLNSISGSIPSSLGALTKLSVLNLCYCNLSGTIPEELHNLSGNLDEIYLTQNRMTGVVPDAMANDQEFWNQHVWSIIPQQSGYGFDSYPTVYVTPKTFTTYAGETIETSSFFADNSLVCILDWATWCSSSYLYNETLKELYETYHDYGFDVLGSCYQDDTSTVESYIATYSIPWHIYKIGGDEGSMEYFPYGSYPTYHFVDSSGAILFSSSLDSTGSLSREEYTEEFVTSWFGDVDPDEDDDKQYESSDYSKDGDVITLQSATVGDGINLVFVGDGFIDTDMASGGEYETRMTEAMENYFSEEPYATYRSRFNVYAVKAVSKHDGVADNGVNDTAFSSVLTDGTTFISGDSNTVMDYALKVPSITSIYDLSIVVVINSSRYAGTCYMYYPSDASIAYCPIVSYDNEQFRQIIVHEAGGHGFAKLLDEYAYSGTISDSEKSAFTIQSSEYGWGANVDITNDPTTIQWAHFLADSRYDNFIGIYEGALTYESGAYRPTDVSIMRYNTGGYNPPSREEIYRRIIELSGDTYSYEEFVSYDQINLTNAAVIQKAAQSDQIDRAHFMHLSEPVMVPDGPFILK